MKHRAPAKALAAVYGEMGLYLFEGKKRELHRIGEFWYVKGDDRPIVKLQRGGFSLVGGFWHRREVAAKEEQKQRVQRANERREGNRLKFVE